MKQFVEMLDTIEDNEQGTYMAFDFEGIGLWMAKPGTNEGC